MGITDTVNSIATKIDARDGYMSNQMVYESVEGIAKERSYPVHRGSSTVTVEIFGFKGGVYNRGRGMSAAKG